VLEGIRTDHGEFEIAGSSSGGWGCFALP
jgi:hypothetical protein